MHGNQCDLVLVACCIVTARMLVLAVVALGALTRYAKNSPNKPNWSSLCIRP